MSAKADYILALNRVGQETRGKIRTFTGRYVNPLDLKAEDICIEDIAHHLSLVCRYSGACPYHYSVGQHSLYVSEQLEAEAPKSKKRIMGLAGLLHDASEAYLNDIASPVKHASVMQWYRELDERVGKLVFEAYGLDPALLAKTKAVDDAWFFKEVRTWWGGEAHVEPRAPASVEAEFLRRFRSLIG